MIETFNSFLSTANGTNHNNDTLSSITEKGALQLLFDLSFIVRVLQNHKHSISILSFLQPLKDKVIIIKKNHHHISRINVCIY